MNALLLSCAIMIASTGVTSEVMEITGTVTVERATKTVPATIGMKLETGDTVVTHQDSHIAFMMPGNALVSLGSDTRLLIEESKDNREGFSSTVNLLKGRLKSLVGGIFGRKVHFNTKTPNAVAGVRGTYIMAEVDGTGQESFYTINGSQEITHNNGTKVMLGSGQGITVFNTGFGEHFTDSNLTYNHMSADTFVPISLAGSTVATTTNSSLNNPSSNAAIDPVISAAVNNSFKSGDTLPIIVPTTAATTTNLNISINFK